MRSPRSKPETLHVVPNSHTGTSAAVSMFKNGPSTVCCTAVVRGSKKRRFLCCPMDHMLSRSRVSRVSRVVTHPWSREPMKPQHKGRVHGGASPVSLTSVLPIKSCESLQFDYPILSSHIPVVLYLTKCLQPFATTPRHQQSCNHARRFGRPTTKT